jgi:hypothetical protein
MFPVWRRGKRSGKRQAADDGEQRLGGDTRAQEGAAPSHPSVPLLLTIQPVAGLFEIAAPFSSLILGADSEKARRERENAKARRTRNPNDAMGQPGGQEAGIHAFLVD